MTGDENERASRSPHARGRPGRIRARPCLAVALLLTWSGAGASPALAASNLSIEATLDRERLAVGEEAQVTVVATARGVALPEFAFPQVPGIRSLRIADSQNFSWVNGKLTRSSTSIFLVSAAAPGRYTIPPIRIVAGAARAATVPLILEVGGVGASSPGVPGPGLPSPSGETPPSRVWGDESLPELFVRFVVDRRRAYWNQQITARFLFYSRERLEEAPVWEIAEASGFWKESLGEMRRGRVRVGKEDYVAYEQDVAYFPTRTGKLKLGPGRVEARVMRRMTAPDPWSFLGLPESRVETIPLQTESASIEVLPLPGAPPKGFRGAVGQLRMDVKVDRFTARPGEPVTVTTILKGQGNLNTAGDPEATASVPLRSFESPGAVTASASGLRIRGERRREKAFVPEVPGSFAIDPIRFTWFDPEEGRYRTQVSDSIRIRVATGGDTSFAGAGPSDPPAAPRSRSGPRGALPLGAPWGAAALGAGSLAALAAVLAVAGARRRASLDPERRRRFDLERLAREMARLRGPGSGPGAAAARAAPMVLRGLGLRYRVEVEGLPRDEAMERLRAAGAAPQDLEAAGDLLDGLDRLAFAPVLAGRGADPLAGAEAFLRQLAGAKT